jgi:hypothetical protein
VVIEDRDIHAAKNIKKIGTLKRYEWSERSSVEAEATVILNFDVKELAMQALEL